MFLLSIPENILLFISCFGVLQGFLLSCLLWFNRKNHGTSNKFLAFFITSLSIVMLGPVIRYFVPWQNTFFLEPFNYLPGPLLYFYVRSFKETLTWRKALPHLFLFLFNFFIAWCWISYMGNKYPGEQEIPEQALRSPLAILMVAARYIQLGFYYFLSRSELSSSRQYIRKRFSESSQSCLAWMKWLINGYLIIIISTIFLFLLMIKFPQHFTLLYLVNMVIVTPYIYINTFKGINHPAIWQMKRIEVKEIVQVEKKRETMNIVNEKQNVQKGSLNQKKTGEIIEKIHQLMQREKLYQETELTLQDLADKLQLPSYMVSQTLNEGMKKNFYELVNSYRVEEAKRLLLDSKNRSYTILSVGFEAGFNSKTTFNTIFKKFTGLTPTDFREKELNTSVAA